MSEIGYYIGYGIDYVGYDDNDIWINYPDGKQVLVTLEDLEHLDLELDVYLKFRLEELRKKKQ